MSSAFEKTPSCKLVPVLQVQVEETKKVLLSARVAHSEKNQYWGLVNARKVSENFPMIFLLMKI